MSRVRVGVSGPDRGGGAAWIMTSVAIRRAGGKPVRITPSHAADLGRLDALVLGGGADVDPRHYREAAEALGEVIQESRAAALRGATPASSRLVAPFVLLLRKVLARPFSGLDPARDDTERRLLDLADARNLPVLGICRGAQLLNVHYGGTLHRDLSQFYVEHPQIRSVLPRKPIELTAGSRLAGALGTTSLLVNALHRQAVRSVGRGLQVVAREPCGVVQAIEDPAHPFRIGVQWHPEFIPQHGAQRCLFEAFVRAAARDQLPSTSPIAEVMRA